MPNNRPDRPAQPTVAELWLRRADRGTVGGLAILAVVLMSAYWFYQGGHRGGLIDVDRAERQQAAFMVDLNQADWPELAALPGVGEQLARRIVASRTADGPFIDHEDLKRVRGIGPRTLDRIRGHLLPLADGRAVAGK